MTLPALELPPKFKVTNHVEFYKSYTGVYYHGYRIHDENNKDMCSFTFHGSPHPRNFLTKKNTIKEIVIPPKTIFARFYQTRTTGEDRDFTYILENVRYYWFGYKIPRGHFEWNRCFEMKNGCTNFLMVNPDLIQDDDILFFVKDFHSNYHILNDKRENLGRHEFVGSPAPVGGYSGYSGYSYT